MKFVICANGKELSFSDSNKFFETYFTLKNFNVDFDKVGFYDNYDSFYTLYID